MMLLNNRFPVIILIIFCAATVMGFVYWFMLPPNLVYPSLPLENSLSLSPSNPLVLKFDRPISKRLQGLITPPVSGAWQVSGQSATFTPSVSLESDNEYLVSLSQVLPIAWITRSQSHNLLFAIKTPTGPSLPKITEKTIVVEPTPTPQTESINLDVPLYKQHYKFTCYTIAAKMALAYRKVEIDEVKFLDEIGYDQTKRNFVTNVWGDPNLGVVGTINGQGVGGYGVHWDPVAKAMSKYVKVEVKRQWNLTELLKTIKAGNPVMVWWVNGVWPAKDISWNNVEGEKTYTVNGMHVEVVRGYQGTPENPELIFTNDPWRGRRQYKPEVFKELWKWFDQTAVIVY